MNMGEQSARHAYDFLERWKHDPPIRPLAKAVGALLVSGSAALGISSIDADALERNVLQVAAADCADPLQEVLPGPAQRHEPMRPHLEAKLNKVPTLPVLGAQFTEYADFEQQLAFINRIDREVQVGICDYASYQIDRAQSAAFVHNESYHTSMVPDMLVLHWTGGHYVNGVHDFIRVMHARGLSAAYFIGRTTPVTHALFENDARMPAHARAMNSFSQGVEIEAEGLYALTPDQLKQAVLLTVDFCRRNNLAISEYTVIGHYAGDVIFNNKSFNSANGTVEGVRKPDMPQELVHVVVRKAQQLDAQLG
jgi:hypothetical protein